MPSKNRLKILNIWVDPVSRQEALDRVQDFIRHGDRPHVVFSSNPEKNFSVPRDPDLFDAYKSADLLLPDGIGVVLAARLLYGIKLSRVQGILGDAGFQGQLRYANVVRRQHLGNDGCFEFFRILSHVTCIPLAPLLFKQNPSWAGDIYPDTGGSLSHQQD